jgi:hypothetical protein
MQVFHVNLRYRFDLQHYKMYRFYIPQYLFEVFSKMSCCEQYIKAIITMIQRKLLLQFIQWKFFVAHTNLQLIIIMALNAFVGPLPLFHFLDRIHSWWGTR